MKRVIWKYRVPPSGGNVIRMPRGAQILCVQTQDRGDTPFINIQLWALVNPDAPLEDRAFAVVGTGFPFDPSNWTYIGTTQHDRGALVFHTFEVKA